MPDPNQTFTAITAIQGLSLGALIGATGQGIRALVGLRKAADCANATGSTLKQEFDGSKLLTSLLIGAVAGMLAALPFISQVGLTYQTLITLLSAGYAGADFIEGFMRKSIPSETGGPTAR
jgi:hypothetical protein